MTENGRVDGARRLEADRVSGAGYHRRVQARAQDASDAAGPRGEVGQPADGSVAGEGQVEAKRRGREPLQELGLVLKQESCFAVFCAKDSLSLLAFWY